MNTECAIPMPVLSAAQPPANRPWGRGADWPAFWRGIQGRLQHEGYRLSTLRLYRQVLRDLRAFLRAQRIASITELIGTVEMNS